MRLEGEIVQWKDEKGFGFIKPASGGIQVFFHIKAFKGNGKRPKPGLHVSYELSRDAQGRACAENVRLNQDGFSLGPATLAFIVSAGFLSLLAVMTGMKRLALPVLLSYLGLSLLTYGAYAWDKSSAQKGHWRISEANLHTLAILGGWPGALFAQQLLRHKTQKQSFRHVFWLTLAVNIGVLAYFVIQGV